MFEEIIKKKQFEVDQITFFKADQYIFLDEISQGTCGKIYDIVKSSTGEHFCCKMLPKTSSKTCIINLITESFILKMLNHPNIVKYIDFVQDNNNYYLIEEFCKGENLLSFLNKRIQTGQYISEKEIRHIIIQILHTLEYLEMSNIAHLDMKLENIIIDENNNFKITIVDFGFSKVVESNSKVKDFRGSLQYISPEIVHHEAFDGHKADVWATGVIMYILLAMKFPFDGNSYNEIAQNIVQGRFEMIPHASKSALSFMSKLLEVNPEKRISASDAICEEYLHHIGRSQSNKIRSFTNFNKCKFTSYSHKKKHFVKHSSVNPVRLISIPKANAPKSLLPIIIHRPYPY